MIGLAACNSSDNSNTADSPAVAVDPGFNGTISSLHFFPGNDGVSGFELYETDGTADGTHLVSDINPSGSSQPQNFLLHTDGMLYFNANDGTHGRELWKSDGTADGTLMVADLAPGFDSSRPAGLISYNGEVYFSAIDGGSEFAGGSSTPSETGHELWKTDGTRTVQVADIFPGPAGSRPVEFTKFGGLLYFVARIESSSIYGRPTLWRTDGTAAGTQQIEAIISAEDAALLSDQAEVGKLTVAGDLLYFASVETGGDFYLWAIDENLNTLRRIKKINTTNGRYRPSGLAFTHLATFGEQLLFGAEGADTATMELWITDGSAAGTRQLSFVSPAGLNPQFITVVGDRALFKGAADGYLEIEVWTTDGTVAGTELLVDISQGVQSFYLSRIVNINGTALFTTQAEEPRYLWASDGTRDGTYIVSEGSTIHNIDTAFLYSQYYAPLVFLDGSFLYIGNDGNGDEPWRTDATNLGTSEIIDLNPGPDSGFTPLYFIN